jgi:chaperonin GroEL
MAKKTTSKKVYHGLQARKGLLKGALDLSRLVGVTYGPYGRNVVLDRPVGILSTKDGVTVAWEYEPQDPVERMGVRIVQEACSKVSKSAGDGTTSTVVLIGAILREAHKWVVAGKDPMLIAQEMQAFVQENLEEMMNLWKRDVSTDTDLLTVALRACNGDRELATALVQVMGKIGTKGVVVLEEGKSRGIEMVFKQGLETDRGWESSDFCPSDDSKVFFELPLVALVDDVLEKAEQVVPILEEASQFPHPLVIVSKGMYGDALKTLLMNQETVKSCGVRCMGHHEFMRTHLDDLAAISGATVWSKELGKYRSEYFGSVQTTTIKKESSTFVSFPDKVDGVAIRVRQLEHQLNKTESVFDQDKLKERIAKLSEGFCLLRVGGASELEIKERRGRLEDALFSMRVAVDGGVVPGGGLTMYKVAQLLEDSDILGERILAKALREPFRRIYQNGRKEPSVVEGLMESCPVDSWVGYTSDGVRDVSQGDGLMDAFMSVLEVIRVSVSTAMIILTSEAAIHESHIGHP